MKLSQKFNVISDEFFVRINKQQEEPIRISIKNFNNEVIIGFDVKDLSITVDELATLVPNMVDAVNKLLNT